MAPGRVRGCLEQGHCLRGAVLRISQLTGDPGALCWGEALTELLQGHMAWGPGQPCPCRAVS